MITVGTTAPLSVVPLSVNPDNAASTRDCACVPPEWPDGHELRTACLFAAEAEDGVDGRSSTREICDDAVRARGRAGGCRVTAGAVGKSPSTLRSKFAANPGPHPRGFPEKRLDLSEDAVMLGVAVGKKVPKPIAPLLTGAGPTPQFSTPRPCSPAISQGESQPSAAPDCRPTSTTQANRDEASRGGSA